jgi:hypothetical protein
MGWKTEWLEFKSRYDQEFSILHIIQTSSGAYSMLPNGYKEGSFPGSTQAGA